MLKAEAKVEGPNRRLAQQARAADEVEKNEPELDISAGIARRQDRFDAIAARAPGWSAAANANLTSSARSDDDDQKPRVKDGKPKGGRCKRPFGAAAGLGSGQLHRS